MQVVKYMTMLFVWFQSVRYCSVPGHIRSQHFRCGGAVLTHRHDVILTFGILKGWGLGRA